MNGSAQIRNISRTGRRNRFYGSVMLLSTAAMVNFVYFLVGETPELGLNNNSTILIVILLGLFTAGGLVLLESTTQVCVYHGFRGTHESSSGSKSHVDESVAMACKSRSWKIILQSVLLGVVLTVVSLWFLSIIMVS
tara:strand:- start:2382 stop:2792 length:411 start_codon:yes stop_codon:yes gene_type:complete